MAHPSTARSRRTWIIYRVLAVLLRIVSFPFVRIVVTGGGALAAHDGAWVMACNHRSVYDFPLAVIALVHFRRVGRIMIASEFWDIPGYGRVLDAIDAIPVYRKTDPVGALEAGIAALKQGKSLCIMPEGTVVSGRARDEIAPLRTGVSRLAVGAEAPVLPICMVGTDDVWPQHRIPRLWRRQTVVCKVAHEPLWLSGDDHRANTRRVADSIRQLLTETVQEWQVLTGRV